MSAELRLLSRVSFRGQEITAPRLRGLLALLAGDLRTGCGTGRLLAGLWPDERPENPQKALQILVSRARGQLGADVIVTTATGYRLALRADQLDAAAVLVSAEACTRHAAAGDHAAALAQADAGLALWDGAADAADDDPVSGLRSQRVPAHRALLRARALALSRLGRPAEAIGPLADLAADRPRDEEVLAELLRCEAATVGPAAALARYDGYRRSLADELGTDPGDPLQELYLGLLQGQAPKVRRGVPHEPNPLLGRADDIAAVCGLLRRSRVASIVGPGGLGKTRLAHAVSRVVEQRSVHIVPLAGITDDDVAGQVAAVLGVGEARRAPVAPAAVAGDQLGGIAAALGPGPALLVLDNCEHVIRGAADVVHALVSMTADVRVLTTSRAPLDLSSESVYALAGLDLPTAVELFTQRARAARPGLELPADAVEEVCRHLDGLPLAVELAAARVRTLSVTEIARRLDDRFALLRGGPRDAPARHRTLTAVVDWSWNLLTPPAQAAMRALSVFAAGFTAAAGARLLGDDGIDEVLAELVGQSLIEVVETDDGTRYRMLETVREFGAARRVAAGEADPVTDAFLAWATDVGLAQHETLFGPDPFSSARLIRAEQDNLLQAFRLGLARSDGAAVIATCAALAGLWTVEANYQRLTALVAEAEWPLSHFRPEPRLVGATRTAAALCAMSTFIFGAPRATRSLVVLRRLPPAPPDTLVGAVTVVLLAIVRNRDWVNAALPELCDSGEPLVAALGNVVAGYLRESLDDPAGALAATRRTLESAEIGASPWLLLMAHGRLGELYLQEERGAEARHHLLAALDLLGPWPDVIGLRWGLMLANLQVGAAAEAVHWLELATAEESVGTYEPAGYGLGIQAEIDLARGETDAGLELWRRAADGVATTDDTLRQLEPTGVDPWALQTQAAAVVAHAQHGRLDLVAELADVLPAALTALLGTRLVTPMPLVTELPTCGALLLAVAVVDLDRGGRGGDPAVTRCAVRMIALAERFRFHRTTYPTLSSARARQAAEHADRSAYEAAVASYADLGPDELRAAALAALHDRAPADAGATAAPGPG